MPTEKNIFITSHNQTGGITAHTVNVGPRARSMSEQIGAQLKQSIPTSASVCVVTAGGDAEALGFAHQILKWMRENGYSRLSLGQTMFSQPVTGQSIRQKNENEFEIIVGTRA